jgi:hypothetical protein
MRDADAFNPAFVQLAEHRLTIKVATDAETECQR